MRLEEIVSQVLEVDPQDIEEQTGYATHAAWTSIAHLEIVVIIEETLGVALTASEIGESTSVGALRRLLKARGVEA
jgi:acyl carrier protein